MSAAQRLVGVDVGGTFTDVLLFDGSTDRVRVRKHLSTRHDPSVAFLEGIDEIAAESVPTATLDRLLHAATVATNTVIQRVGARTGLICTQGFRDLLEIGRGTRPTTAIYDLQRVRPQALVPRFLRLGVPERTDKPGPHRHTAGRGGVAGCAGLSARARRRGDRDLLPVLVPEPGKRKAGDATGGAASPRPAAVGLLADPAAMARIRAHQHHSLRRLCQGGDEPLYRPSAGWPGLARLRRCAPV